MRKIGFIDYYLDEWHANNYPALIERESEGRYTVECAYGMIDSPIGGITNSKWSEKFNIPLVSTIEELINRCDVVLVLSPDNPEMHEQLCEEALKSGKPVYIDKTFAPDKKTALKFFDMAKKYNTPCYSASSLRFSEEIEKIDKKSIHKLYTEGGELFEQCAIHQIEQIVYLMECPAKRVMALGDENHPSLMIEFEDGRTAQMNHYNEVPFKLMVVNEANDADTVIIESDFFGRFINKMIEFFDSGEIVVPHNQTIEIIAIREAGIKAIKEPFKWMEV